MNIDYTFLVQAQRYFESLGYSEVHLPWLVSKSAIVATLPEGRDILETKLGALAASGEQSFIELMLQGKTFPQKAYCITPCFRDEEVFDELHHPSFLKLELIHTDATMINVNKMIQDVLQLYKKSMEIEIEDMHNGTFDIVDSKNKIELGSYGIRKYKNFSWVYGTGLALPRFTTVLSKQ